MGAERWPPFKWPLTPATPHATINPTPFPGPSPMYLLISDLHFELSAPFLPGHPLTAGEAQALNSLRAKRIRDALYKEVGGAELDGATALRAREFVARADKEFEFAPWAELPTRPTELEKMIAHLREEGIGEAETIDRARQVMARRAAAAKEFLGLD